MDAKESSISSDRRNGGRLKKKIKYNSHNSDKRGSLKKEDYKKRRSSSRSSRKRSFRSRSKKRNVKNEGNKSISNEYRYDTDERKFKRITKSRSAEHRKKTKNCSENSRKQSSLKEKKSKRKNKSRSREKSHKNLSKSRERCSYRERSKNKNDFFSKSRKISVSPKREKPLRKKCWSTDRSRDRSYSYKRRSQKVIDRNHESYSDTKIKIKLCGENDYNYEDYNYKYDKNHRKKENGDNLKKEKKGENLKGYAEEMFGSQREHIQELIKNNNKKMSPKSSVETNHLISSLEFVKNNPKTLTNEISNINFETDLKSKQFSCRPNGFNDILSNQGSAPPNMTFLNLRQPPPAFHQSPPRIQQPFHQPPPSIQTQHASFLNQAPSKHLFKTLHRPEFTVITSSQIPFTFLLNSEHLVSSKSQLLTSYHSDSNLNFNLHSQSQQHTPYQLMTHQNTSQQQFHKQNISQQHTQHKQHTQHQQQTPQQQQTLQQQTPQQHTQQNILQQHTQQKHIPPQHKQHYIQNPTQQPRPHLANSSLNAPYTSQLLDNSNHSNFLNNNANFISPPPTVMPFTNMDNNQSLPPPPPPPQEYPLQHQINTLTSMKNHLEEDKLSMHEGVSGSYSPYSSTSEGSAFDSFSNNLLEESSSNINPDTLEIKLKNGIGMIDEQAYNIIKNVQNTFPSLNSCHSAGNNGITQNQNGSDHLVSLAKNLDLSSSSTAIHFNDLKKVLETANNVTNHQNSHNHNNQSKVVTTTKTSKERKIDQVVEEVKNALRPHFSCSLINKEEYKNIMRKAVPKIMSSKSDLKSARVKNFIQQYVNKVLLSKKIHRIKSKKDKVKT